GPAAADRNVISGNGFAGANIFGAADTLVQGNFIGTTAAGNAALGNDVVGVTVQFASSTGNRVTGNLIAANGPGIAGEGGVSLIKGSSGTRVDGNLIGLAAGGLSPLGNAGPGIRIESP